MPKQKSKTPKQNVGDDIIQGLNEAIAFAKGEDVDARVHSRDGKSGKLRIVNLKERREPEDG
jgi:hypothetical protein|tara:strand:+ start:2720 stop:2905 length:186 start_codon:yes stop_codon:yes gene_type:complete